MRARQTMKQNTRNDDPRKIEGGDKGCSEIDEARVEN
jgi:hypothetical protein